EETPSCLPPTALTVSNITNNAADLSWTASISNPANGYQWEVRSSGNPGDPGPDANGTTAAGMTTASATGLVANTAYTLYVRSDCGSGSFSTWASATFRTLCDATNVPYTQDFEGAVVPALPTCMSREVISGNQWITTSSGLNGKSAQYSYNSTQAANSWLYTQGLNLTGGQSYRLTYSYGNNGGGTFPEKLAVAYGNSPSAAAMTNALADHDPVTTASNTNVIDFIPATTGVYYIGFQAHSDADEFYLFVDDISVKVTPTCFPPDAYITDLSGGTATINWTNNASASYNWELRDSGNPGDPSPIASGYHVAGGPVSIPGLTVGNTYTFYIQGWCSASDSSEWAATSVYMGYCAAGATANSTNLKIARVAFADVDNPSSSAAGYEDFTAIVGNVQAGASYPMTIDISEGLDADRLQVWIDIDQNLVFTPDERVVIESNPPYQGGGSVWNYTINTNFHLSAFALSGNTRMRIRFDNTINGPNPDPCGNSVFGQVEDYTLNVSPAPCAPPVATTSVTPDCANFAFSVDVDVTDLGDGASVTVSDNQGSPAQNGGLGTYSFGPYVNGTQVTYLITFGGDPLCDNYVTATYACTPTNQDCSTAQGLTVYPAGSCVATNGSTINVAAESMAGSGCINPDISLPSVYYSFVATGYANTITTVGTPPGNFTTTVFDACGGNELACSFGSAPILVTGLTAGNTYYIRVAATVEANFTICVEESAVQPVPNDACSNAEAVTISPYGACTPATGTLFGATSSGAPPSCINQSLLTNDVFYSFVANGNRQIITLNQDSINQPYFIGVYDGCGGTELLCELIGPGYTPIGTELGLSGLTAGNTYIVRVLCRPPASGPFDLCVMDPPPATQIQCGGPAVETNYCYTANDDQQWAYHSNGTGDFTLTFNSGQVEASVYDIITIYDGPDASSPILYQTPSTYLVDLTGVSVTATGSDLFMTLTSDGSIQYCFTWTVQCAYHPDLACDANPVECGNTYPGLTAGLGHHAPVDACAFNGAASTGGTEWFSYTAAEDAHVTFSTCSDAGFDTRISVFSGSDCNTLSCLAMNDDYPGCANGGSSVDINVTTGNTYWIMVTGAGAQEGEYSLTVTCQGACTVPANDNCSSAQALANNLADGGNSPGTHTNACAMVDAPTTCSGAMPVQGVWFTFNSGNYDHALLTLVDNGDDAQYSAGSLDYALYSGSCAGMGATASVACVA
ncbi:MAG: fibronectin type III domain-containing protein, partial [Flavobacteriales bacterium]|nr:fibronectin type III domain-containing protein [Flavobacteriales bacterium]